MQAASDNKKERGKMEILDFKTAVVFVSLAVAAFVIDFFCAQEGRENLAKASRALVYILDRRSGGIWRIFVFYRG